MVEVAAVQGARQRQSRGRLRLHRHPGRRSWRGTIRSAVIPVAILLGGIGASGGLLQRRLGLPDASVLVLQGIIFVIVLASDSLYGRLRFFARKGGLTMADAAESDYGACRSRCSAAPCA